MDSLLITRIRAPFSSLSRWLSAFRASIFCKGKKNLKNDLVIFYWLKLMNDTWNNKVPHKYITLIINMYRVVTKLTKKYIFLIYQLHNQT